MINPSPKGKKGKMEEETLKTTCAQKAGGIERIRRGSGVFSERDCCDCRGLSIVVIIARFCEAVPEILFTVPYRVSGIFEVRVGLPQDPVSSRKDVFPIPRGDLWVPLG